jgi:gliding motility-associated-like protein
MSLYGNGLAQSSAFNFSYPGPDTLAVGVNCTAVLQGGLGTPQVTSAVGATITNSSFNAVASGFGLNDPHPNNTTRIVHWSVADNAGNSHVFTFPIEFRDRMSPVLNTTGVPAVVSYQSVNQIPVAPTLTADDNCTPSANITIALSQTPLPAACATGSVTRTWTATDASGNTTTFLQTILITLDNAGPSITSFPTSTFQACNQNMNPGYQAWLNAQMNAFSATDASGTPTYSNNAPVTFPVGCQNTVVVVFTATDACGNKTTATAEYGTNDLVKPNITQEARDSVVYCSSTAIHTNSLSAWINQRALATATDQCTPTNLLQWFMTINGVNTDSAGVMAAFAASMAQPCAPKTIGGTVYDKVKAVIDVDFYVKDLCNNTEHAGRASFGVIDTTPPVLVQPTASVRPCLGANNVSAVASWIQASGNASASDFCTSAIWSEAYHFVAQNGDTGAGTRSVGPYPVIPNNTCNWYFDATFYATDLCGNQDSITVRYQMNDQIGPAFTNLPNVDTFSCVSGIPPGYTTTALDACSGAVTPTYTTTLLNSPCAGTKVYRINWSATDGCNNTTNATSRVVLIDQVGPQFVVVPADTVMSCAYFAIPASPMGTPSLELNDNCSGVTSVLMNDVSTKSTNPITCAFSQYTIRRTFTAFDGCGNTNTAVQIISVVDTIGPEFTGLADTLVNCSAIADPMTANFPLPTARDLCNNQVYPLALVERVVTAGSCADNYDLRIRWKATDVCNNESEFEQVVRARDTIAPGLSGIPANITVDCIQIPQAPTLGNGLVAADNCDNSVTVLLNETEIRIPDSTKCAHYNYELKREWIASDNCGNFRAYTQILTIRDETPPIILCHPDIIVPNLTGQCDAMTNIPFPTAIFDECSVSSYTAMLRDTQMIKNTSGLPNNNAVVDTIRYRLAAPNFSDTWPASTLATLKLHLKRADAEQPDEHIKVFGENKKLLGVTSPTSAQCGDGTTTLFVSLADLNNWLMDGALELTLIPNGTGPTAINAICPGGGTVAAELSYTYVKPNVPVTTTYQINLQAPQSFPAASNVTLPGGMNQITYTATDCSGNQASCVVQVNILDTESPTIGLVDTMRAWAPAQDCNTNLLLKAPSVYSDNCTLGDQHQQASSVTATIFQQDANAGNIPADISHAFTASPQNASSAGTLTFRYLGDIAEAGEFFSIYTEKGHFLGNTSLSPLDSQCVAWHKTQFNLHPDSIKSWAADGNIQFKAIANNDAGGYTEFIHPCGTLTAQKTDGISKWQMLLNYRYAEFDYTLRNAANTIVGSGVMKDQTTPVTLPVGTYQVQYQLADPTGNVSSRNSTLLVLDTIAPTALCKNSLVPIDIGGNGTFTLSPAQLDNQSSDNCTIASISLSQTQFSCGQSGNTIPVVLSVTDQSGLVSKCTSIVQIQTSGINPSYLSGVCTNQALQLYANPQNDPGQTFTYLWTGPNNFTSQLANPVIPMAATANAGTYNLTATNINGCSTTASVFVSVVNQPNVPVIQKDKAGYCTGEQIVLSTQAYGSANATYTWYRGAPGSSTVLGTTTSPQYTINGATIGQANYYVIATVNNCPSAPSAPVIVIVNQAPTATVAQAQAAVCEGSALTLVASNQNPNLSYAWSGPSFTAGSAQATVTNTAAPVHAGTYQLVASANGCSSAPVTVQVQVLSRPQQPVLSSNSPLCLGQQISFNSTATGVDNYHWVSPLQDTIVTTSSSLQLTSLNQMSGSWSLFVTKAGCASVTSSANQVIIEGTTALMALANSPVCANGVLQLQAQTVGSGLNFRWTGPAGFSTLIQNPISSPIAGTYIVTSTTPLAGCASVDTVEVVVVNNPIITSVSSNAPLCATGTTNARLDAVIFPINPSYQYQWTGPNGFTSANAQPTIPNISGDDAGQYHLVVTDQFGCASEPQSTTIITTDAPAIPVLAPVQSLCAGNNLEIILQNTAAYQGINVTYIWHTPTGGVVTTTNPSLQKANVNVTDGGLYWVEVMNGNCISLPSAQVNVVVVAIPPSPAIFANTPICEGDTLKLTTNIPAGTDWQWTGPSGFAPNTSNPVITAVDASLHSGLYQVSYAVQGCRSLLSDPYLVQITERPGAPTILPPQAACIDIANSTLQIQLQANTTTPGASYAYYLTPGNLSLGMPNFGNMYMVDSLSNYGAGTKSVYVIAESDGCYSLPSTAVMVNFDTIPAQTAYAGADFNACVQAPIQLQAGQTQVGTGQWSQVAAQSLTINSPTQVNTTAQGGQADQNYQFIWSLSNGGCTNYSRDTVQVAVRAFENAVSVPVIDSCFVQSAQLNAQAASSGAAGFWSQPQTQVLLDVVIVNPSDPNTQVVGIEPGNTYTFYWNLPDMGCGAASDTTILRSIGSEAITEPDRTICSQTNCGIISAAPLAAFETGVWTSLNPQINVAMANGVQTSVCGLRSGDNHFVWTTNNGKCGERSVDTLTIRYEQQPITRPDTVLVPFGERVEFSVLLNDTYPSNFREQQITQPKYGVTERLAPGIYRYTPALSQQNEDVFTYSVCNLFCPDTCPPTIVVLKLQEPGTCVVPTVITPNDDQVNDKFYISCLENDDYPDNEVLILNSNGDKVFYASPYRNDWSGKGENGRDLTPGTYFFIVRFNGASREDRGFLELRR